MKALQKRIADPDECAEKCIRHLRGCSVRIPPGLLERYPALRKQLKVKGSHISKAFRVQWSRVRSYLIKRRQSVYSRGEKAYLKDDRAYWKQVAFMDKASLIHSGEPRIAIDSLKTRARWQNMALPDLGSTADRYAKKRSAICDRLRKEFESKVLSLYEAEPSILIIP